MSRHPFGFGRFLFGVLFGTAAGLWLVRDHIDITVANVAIVAPAALILLGVFGIVITLRKVDHVQTTDAQPS